MYKIKVQSVEAVYTQLSILCFDFTFGGLRVKVKRTKVISLSKVVCQIGFDNVLS